MLLETALSQRHMSAALDRTRVLLPFVLGDVNSLLVGAEAAAASEHHHAELTLLLKQTLVDKFLEKVVAINFRNFSCHSHGFYYLHGE